MCEQHLALRPENLCNLVDLSHDLHDDWWPQCGRAPLHRGLYVQVRRAVRRQPALLPQPPDFRPSYPASTGKFRRCPRAAVDRPVARELRLYELVDPPTRCCVVNYRTRVVVAGERIAERCQHSAPQQVSTSYLQHRWREVLLAPQR
jgi:hypothetical protein